MQNTLNFFAAQFLNSANTITLVTYLTFSYINYCIVKEFKKLVDFFKDKFIYKIDSRGSFLVNLFQRGRYFRSKITFFPHWFFSIS
jgi:hypothetical protein